MVDLVQKEMTLVWAETGDIIQPDDTKISNGWDVELVPRQWWNWMQNRVDHNVAYLLQKGFPEWSAAVEYVINKSYVQHLGVVYKCIQTHTNQTPVVGAYWVKAFVESSNSLEAIQPLTVAADKIAYYTGANSAATTTLTSFARTLLDDTSASAARTTLGAQAADATLTALAGVATGLNKLPYFTGTDAADVTDLSAYGRTLIATADAAAARTTLGLQSGATTSVGTIATQNANNVAITGGSIAGITDLAIADGGTGASNASDARSNLGLGTAATGDVTTSTIDSTIGRILRVGDFGFGSTTLPITNDFNAITGSGWYANTSGAAVGLPLADRIFTVMHVALNANTAMQYAIDTFTSTTDQRVFVRTKNTGTWAAWNEVWTSENQLNIGTTASSARTALALANSATIAATSANTASTLVQRDGGGSFSAGTITATLSGNASTATTLIGDQSNWASYRASAVANMLGWKKYGNGHVIFDASNGTAPNGTAINADNPGSSWVSGYPSIMGWNGTSTFGVKVDRSQTSGTADTAATISANAVNIDSGLGAWNAIYEITTNTAGTFHAFQSKNGVMYHFGGTSNLRSQVHFPSSGTIWKRNFNGSVWSNWTTLLDNENSGLTGGQITFAGNGSITILRNRGNLSVSRSSVGRYDIGAPFGLSSSQTVVAMCADYLRTIVTAGASQGGTTQIGTVPYNSNTFTDSAYVCVILGG